MKRKRKQWWTTINKTNIHLYLNIQCTSSHLHNCPVNVTTDVLGLYMSHCWPLTWLDGYDCIVAELTHVIIYLLLPIRHRLFSSLYYDVMEHQNQSMNLTWRCSYQYTMRSVGSYIGNQLINYSPKKYHDFDLNDGRENVSTLLF